jgi:probable HAF family extracellular repeat protein
MCGVPMLDPVELWAAQSYTVRDLGIADAVKGIGPNLSGQTAVRSGFVDAQSFRSTPGASTDSLGLLPGSDYFTANGINDAGAVVGSATISFGSRQCRPNTPSAPPSGTCLISTIHAIIWTKSGGQRDLGTLPGDTASEAFGINNSGAVVGYSSGPQGTRAVLWTPQGEVKNLGTLPLGGFSKAFAISNTGIIVGSSRSPAGTHAVLWHPAKGIQDLGTLPGDISSEAFAVNNIGIVVGYSKGPAGTHAFLWKSETGMKRLPPLLGSNVSRAMSINDNGEVVGHSGSINGGRAVFWNSNGIAQDLNDLVFAPAGVTLFDAAGINAKGQIMVLGGDEQNLHGFHEGSNRAFLLTP